MQCPVFVLAVQAEPGDPIRRLRAWLKIGLRTFGLRCISIEQRRKDMDTRKYSAGFITAEDVRDGLRHDRIVNVLESTAFNSSALVLDLESGDQFRLNRTNTKILQKAWGFESDAWIGLELELSLGTYKDWSKDPPEDKETVIAQTISPRPQGNGTQVILPPRPPPKGELDDEIPF